MKILAALDNSDYAFYPLKKAVQNNIEMIVMGHKSRSVLGRILVGSVAVKVVTDASCSVLVIR